MALFNYRDKSNSIPFLVGAKVLQALFFSTFLKISTNTNNTSTPYKKHSHYFENNIVTT